MNLTEKRFFITFVLLLKVIRIKPFLYLPQ